MLAPPPAPRYRTLFAILAVVMTLTTTARFARADNIFRQGSSWGQPAKAEYGSSSSTSGTSGFSGSAWAQRPPVFTLAPRFGLASVNVEPLQNLLADPTSRSFAFSWGLELGYRLDNGLRFGLAGMRLSFGKSSTDYTATFTGNYAIGMTMLSGLIGYDLLNFGRARDVAGSGPRSIIGLGPLVELGLGLGTNIEGANAYGEQIQSASTTLPFASLALALSAWKRGLPVGASLRLGYRYFPTLTFPNGTTQLNLSAVFLDFAVPISL